MCVCLLKIWRAKMQPQEGKCLTKCRHFSGGRTNPGIGLQPVLSSRVRTGAAHLRAPLVVTMLSLMALG